MVLTSALRNLEFSPSKEEIIFVKYTPFLFNDFLIFLTASNVVKVFAGDVPEKASFNIASYSLLLMMVAQVTGLEVGEFVHTLGDAHIYSNHFEQVDLQLQREPRKLPRMIINPEVKDIFDFKYEDFELVDYDPLPHIAGVVAV